MFLVRAVGNIFIPGPRDMVSGAVNMIVRVPWYGESLKDKFGEKVRLASSSI